MTVCVFGFCGVSHARIPGVVRVPLWKLPLWQPERGHSSAQQQMILRFEGLRRLRTVLIII